MLRAILRLSVAVFALTGALPIAAWSAELHTSMVMVKTTQQAACAVTNVSGSTVAVDAVMTDSGIPSSVLTSSTLIIDPGVTYSLGMSTPPVNMQVFCSLSFKGSADSVRAVLRLFDVSDLWTTLDRSEAR